ncbi:MAG: hypothetical protein NZ761_08620 [Dehalococcoidia bacterium]|nr:hypothetical protein [Dehalococcoidia bacterium]
MRRIVRFASVDGSIVLPLPLLAGEQSEEQSARLALGRAPSAPYAADLQGSRRVVVDAATVRLRALLLAPDDDGELDQLRARLRGIGRGRLWMQLENGSERWCWARAQELATYQVSAERPSQTVVALTFVRLSDWYADALATLSQAVATSGTTVTVTSSGLVPTTELTVTLVASGTVSGLALQNQVTGELVATTRTLATGQRIRLRVPAFRVLYSADGTNWTDDWANTQLGPLQAGLLSLVPGPNPLRLTWTGSGSVTLTVEWRDAYP